MITKSFKYICTLCLIGLLCTSCNSWIEENPDGLVTDERVGDSEEAAAAWVTGTYSKLIYDMFCWGVLSPCVGV